MLAVCAIGFVGYQLTRENRLPDVLAALFAQPGVLILLSIASAGLGAVLCCAWGMVVRAGGGGGTWGDNLYLFASTYIYRYLPSNVVHVAGRQLALVHRGASHPRALAINGLEFVLQVIAAGILVTVQGAQPILDLLPGVIELPSSQALLLTGASATIIAALTVSYWRKPLRRINPSWPWLGAAVVVYAGYFLATAALALPLGADAAGWTVTLSVVTTAWLAGAFVPGASAGMGIREALIVAGLTPHVGTTSALTVALGLRLLSVSGDVLLFAAARLLRPNSL